MIHPGCPPRALVLVLTAVGTLTGCQSLQSKPTDAAQRAWSDQRAALKYELASAELHAGHVDEAMSLARETVGLSPNQPAHAELLARVYLAKGDLVAALSVLEGLRESHPQFAPAHYLLGTVYEQQCRWREAADAFQRAASTRPEVLEYRLAWAQAVAAGGDVRGGIDALRAVEERFAPDPRYHLACAELHRQAGELPAACEAYQRALQLGIEDDSTRQALGLCLYWLGRHREALDYLEPIVLGQSKPEPAALSAYAGCLLASGRVAQAVDWLARFTMQRPEVGPLWFLLAQARSAAGDNAGAVEAATRAARLMPRAPDVYTALAAIQLTAGRADLANDAVQKALALQPDNVEALLMHGRLWERLGERGRAAEVYQAVLQKEPDNELAAELLAAASHSGRHPG